MAPNSSTLKTLHLLLTRRMKDASLALDAILQRQQSMRQILTLLHRNHMHHMREVEKFMRRPMPAALWRDYQNYLEHLETDINRQMKDLVEVGSEKERGQAALRQQRSHQRAAEHLAHCQTQAQQHLAQRLEERVSEDRSAHVVHAHRSHQLRLSARS